MTHDEKSKVPKLLVCAKCKVEVLFEDFMTMSSRGENFFARAVKCLDDGRCEKALEHGMRVLNVRRKILHSTHKDLAETEDLVGRIFATAGDYKQASSHVQTSIKILEVIYGCDAMELCREYFKLDSTFV
eukprot:TRINITY_DN1065_c0_g1_i1.p1 TRINITY_DN1065_c0_g1~~TRINITY_DN1065_c0_g1_i1.p1  ORF type:complete len:143 (-),score=25.48 TRINITY_DN1065_c0_g1_i1:196-585(-)